MLNECTEMFQCPRHPFENVRLFQFPTFEYVIAFTLKLYRTCFRSVNTPSRAIGRNGHALISAEVCIIRGESLNPSHIYIVPDGLEKILWLHSWRGIFFILPLRHSYRDSADSVGSVTSKLEATSVTSRIERDSEFYDMTHARRGIAVIFNHIHFTNMATRSGTVKDCKNLGEALANLGFEVRVYNDPTLKTISSVLKSGEKSATLY